MLWNEKRLGRGMWQSLQFLGDHFLSTQKGVRIKFWYPGRFGGGSGYGKVDRAVATNTRGPRFETQSSDCMEWMKSGCEKLFKNGFYCRFACPNSTN